MAKVTQLFGGVLTKSSKFNQPRFICSQPSPIKSMGEKLSPSNRRREKPTSPRIRDLEKHMCLGKQTNYTTKFAKSEMQAMALEMKKLRPSPIAHDGVGLRVEMAAKMENNGRGSSVGLVTGRTRGLRWKMENNGRGSRVGLVTGRARGMRREGCGSMQRSDSGWHVIELIGAFHFLYLFYLFCLY
ncbi:hypothetical protein ACJIZ3_019221 [Penstemon smallii]|uniref:Uncharacterized protein n=1 Tax=Penstemon smallii TaxID=265156 RepID=A0ABD3T0K7_9LAMI